MINNLDKLLWFGIIHFHKYLWNILNLYRIEVGYKFKSACFRKIWLLFANAIKRQIEYIFYAAILFRNLNEILMVNQKFTYFLSLNFNLCISTYNYIITVHMKEIIFFVIVVRINIVIPKLSIFCKCLELKLI